MSEFRPTTTDMAPWLEQAWMERYLNRELTEDENDWFEAYLLDRPKLAVVPSVDLNAFGMIDKERPVGLRIVPWSIAAASIVSCLFLAFKFLPTQGGFIVEDFVESNQPTSFVLDSMRGHNPTWRPLNSESSSQLVLIAIPSSRPSASLVVYLTDGKIMRLGPQLASDGFYSFLITRDAGEGELFVEYSDSERIQLPTIGKKR